MNTSQPPRVALFTDSDGFAGTERHMLDLARGLKASGGVTVLIACPSPSPLASGAAELGVTVIPIAKRGMIDAAAIQDLRRRLRSGEIDLLHAHNGRTALQAALAVTAAGRGVCIATQHFLEPNRVSQTGIKGAASQVLHGWVGRQTAHYIAISQAVAQGMRARGEAVESQFTVIPNGISLPELSAMPAPAQVREALGIPADAPLVVCAARLEPEKDVASLIHAMKAVSVAHPNARCLIAGEGSQQSALEALIAGEGLEDAVRLLGFRTDVLALIRAGDVFALPSLAEPFGLALLEAMALEKPVVATSAGGPLEIVADGETGLLVPPAQPQALAEAISSLLRDLPHAQALGRNGRARFDREFTAARMAAATRGVYQRALAAPSPG